MALGCGHVGIDLGGDAGTQESPSDASMTEDASASSGGTGGTGSDKTPDESTAGEPGTVADDPSHPDSGGGNPAEDGGETIGEPLDAGVGEPADASLDGGMTDEPDQALSDAGSGPAPKDSGTAPPVPDSGSDTPPEEVIDSGVTQTDSECAPNCNCLAGESCELTCTSSPCWPECAAGATCSVAVGEATEVGIGCGDGATCTATEPSGEAVAYTCEGPGDCTASCGNVGTCSLDCVGTGTCSLHCGNAANCVLECAELSRCKLVRENVETTTTVSCANDTRTECSDALIACNLDCPAPL